MNVTDRTSFATSNEVTVSTGCCAGGRNHNILSSNGQRFQITTILTLTLVPILALNVIASVSVRDSTVALFTKENIHNGITFSLETGILLRFTQIERGMSAFYLSSQSNSEVYKSLLEKYKATDDIIQNLSKWPQLAVGSPLHFKSKLTFFENIKKYRKRVMANNITIEETIRIYTDDNSVIIGWAADSIRHYVSGNLWLTLVAYHMLLLASDEVGVERALGTTFFTTGTFSNEKAAWYVEEKVTAEHYLELSKHYSDEVRQLINNNIVNSELYHTLTEMRQKIIGNSDVSVSATTSTLWFDNMTSYIDILKDIKDSVGQSILSTLQREMNDVSVNYKLSIGLLSGAILMYPTILFVVFTLTKQIQSVATSFRNQASSLSTERKRSEHLLCQMLPASVAKKMMGNEKIEPKLYSSATVCFTDIVGFTTICSGCTPFQVVDLLNLLFNTFDARLEKYDVYKVETIGDAYMVVSGVPETNGERHASEIAFLALDLLNATMNLNIPELLHKTINLTIRIGVNTGPVVSGVVGIKMPRYCLFGDTVNVASRMESTGTAGKIQLSTTTMDALRQFPCFQTQERGLVNIKGKGEMKTHWLVRSTVSSCHHVELKPTDHFTVSTSSD